jgi:hypothetical protein
MGRTRRRRESHISRLKLLIVFCKFVSQNNLSSERNGYRTLKIVNIHMLPFCGTDIGWGRCVHRASPSNIDFVLGVIENDFISTIVCCVIRVIGFRGIEETVGEHTTHCRHVHLEFRMPRVGKLKGPVDPPIIEIYGRGVPCHTFGRHVSSLRCRCKLSVLILIVVEKDVISRHVIYDCLETWADLFDVYTGDPQCATNDIQYTIIWVYGHF